MAWARGMHRWRGVERLDYIGYLARTVPPSRLARVAALRIWRGARQSLLDPPAPPSEDEILRAFLAPTAQALPRRLAAPVPGPWGFSSPPAVEATARSMRRSMPREVEIALAQAEASLARRITLFGREAHLPEAEREVPLASPGWRAVDWERDPVSGARFAGGRMPPGSDVKYPWALGRLEEAVHLACGAALVRDDPARSGAFADAAIDRALDLFTAPLGVQWTCPMEVALRAANVAIALRVLAGHPALETRGEALLAILRGLVLHLRWVEAHPEDTVAVPNNHLVANLVGPAVVGALLPRLPGAAQGARRALLQLERELFSQTLPDGFTFEASVGYHRLAVELFLLADLAATGLAAPFGPDATQRLAAMFRASAALVDGRGLAPQIGDNDAGRALPFRRREPQEQAWLLPIGAARFGRAELHLCGPGAELAWLLGPAGLRRLEGLRRGRRQRDTALRHAGIYVLRSRRLSCAIACGPNGTGGTGTHGHNDKLAVEICLDGRLLVGDPGTGSYTGDPALRERLRGTAAHSTLVVEGQEQQPLPAGRLFALPERAHARCVAFESGVAGAFFAGEHRGYLRLRQRVIHRREVRLDRRKEALVITDRLQGDGSARAEVRWLLPEARARIRTLAPAEHEAVSALLADGCIQPQAAVELSFERGPVALLVGVGASASPWLEPALYARGYGEVGNALHACFPLAGALPMLFSAVLLAVE